MEDAADVKSMELFCVTGGFALGLQQAGFSYKALYESDKASCDNIKFNSCSKVFWTVPGNRPIYE